MKRVGVVMIMCMWLAASAFAQGLYWQSKTTGTVGQHTSEMYAMPKKMKMVSQDKTHPVSIIRLDKEVIWSLDPDKKTYSEMTFAQLEQVAQKAGGKMDEAMAKMKDKMKDMTPEQRQMMEKMMGERMKGMSGASETPVEVSKTGEKKTISGYACTQYVAKQGDDVVMTLWVTNDVKGFDELRDDWKAFSQRISSMTSRFGKGMADAYKNINGFPIQTEMGQGIVTTVTKVEKRSTPASEFEIPSGYTKVKSEAEQAMEKMDKEDK